MEDERKSICRFCLRDCKNSFESIEETTREILNSLLINLDLSISNEPVMCNSCGNKLNKCFKFKKECLCAHSRPLTSIRQEDGLKEDMPIICSGNTVESNAVDFSSEHALCCFCMNSAKCTSFRQLKIQDVKIVESLQKYFPELDVDVTKQLMVCNPCYESLQYHLSFVSECLSVEKMIREYCDIAGVNFKGQVALNNVLNCKSNNVIDTCKEEEMFCEPAEGLGDNVEIKQEDFINAEFQIKTECVFIKVEQNLHDSGQESTPLLKSEPNTWGVDEEISDAAVDSKSEICAIETTYANNLNHKNVSEMTEKMYKCDSCSYQTNIGSHFQRHALTHKNASETTVYKCDICDYETTLKEYLQRHMVVHKSISEVPGYKCKMCVFQTKYRTSIIRHVANHKSTPKIRVYNCDLCTYKANRKLDLKKHTQQHKNSSARKSVVSSLETSGKYIDNRGGASKVTAYTCEICGHQTLVKGCLTRHMLSHKDVLKVTMYNCELCTYQTKDERSLRQHKESHKTVIYKCDTCTFKTKHEPSFQNHLQFHDGTAKLAVYKCEECDYQSKYNWHLQQHVLTHATIPSIMYMCTLCSYATDDKSDLRTHTLAYKNTSVVDSNSTSVISDNSSVVNKDVSVINKHVTTLSKKSSLAGSATSSTLGVVKETAAAVGENGSQLVADTLSQCINRLSSWISEYEEELCVLNDFEIMCNVCSKFVQVTRKHHITQHVEGKSHLMKLSSQPRDNFNEELCQTLLAANIPLQKIDNAVLKQFLEKYMCRTIPAGSTLRKYCVANIYKKIMSTIRKNISNNYLWVSADEATDPLGRCVVNVVVGTLRPNDPSDSYLVATKIIETVTAENVAIVINSALEDLRINNDEVRSKVLLFLTGAAAYMLETGKLLKMVYPNLLHITCTAHALHGVCEFIRSEFKTVDTLISTFKKTFLKAPLRSLYKNICPLPLPPEPVTTRWATWIEAALFYSKNLETLKEVVNCLDNDAHSITGCKNIIKKPALYHDLKYIDDNFSYLPEHIKYFETQNVPLKERISKLKSITTHLQSIPKEFGHRLKQKVEAIYAENPDISVLYVICTENFENQQMRQKYKDLIPYFKYAPLTSCDVERTFSRFNDLLSPKRSNFTETNLEHHLIINANSKVRWNTDVEGPQKRNWS